MDVKNTQKPNQTNFNNSNYYDLVSKILAFVDKVDNSKNIIKKGDSK